PTTGNDLGHAPGAAENCEAACNDCLMSYVNQTDHRDLDRKQIKDILLDFAASQLKAAPASVPRAEHLSQLKKLAGSNLERDWLEFLELNGLRLPATAQRFFQPCKTRPDFFYDGVHQAA